MKRGQCGNQADIRLFSHWGRVQSSKAS